MMKTCFFCLLVSYVVLGVDGAPKGRILQGEAVFDITSYGAKGDGTTDDAMVEKLNFTLFCVFILIESVNLGYMKCIYICIRKHIS